MQTLYKWYSGILRIQYKCNNKRLWLIMNVNDGIDRIRKGNQPHRNKDDTEVSAADRISARKFAEIFTANELPRKIEKFPCMWNYCKYRSEL